MEAQETADGTSSTDNEPTESAEFDALNVLLEPDGLRRGIHPLDYVDVKDINWKNWVLRSYGAPNEFGKEVEIPNSTPGVLTRNYHALIPCLGVNITAAVHSHLEAEGIILWPEMPTKDPTASPVTIGDARVLMVEAEEEGLIHKSPSSKFAYLPELAEVIEDED